MTSATIKLFLVHGDAKRLRTAEQLNWTGLALAAPRADLDELVARPESDRPGVYFLTGFDSSRGRSSVYIGEAESIRPRLKQHIERDYWQQAIFFVSKDENLTKSHIRYLEGRLIEEATKADRSDLKNAQASGARLPESDRADMELFLGKIKQLLPVLGADFLVPVSGSREQGDKTVVAYETNGAVATGYRTASGFVVEAGSTAVEALRKSAYNYPWLVRLRERLIEDGALVQTPSGYTFSRDTEFDSPSGAATVICGGTANGLTVWKDGLGRQLKEIETQDT